MKTIKNLVLIILSLFLISASATAQVKKKKIIKKKKTVSTKPVVNPMPIPPINPFPVAAYKVLIEGQHSKVEAPFVFVARDAETYALIRSMVEGLPPSTNVDFSKSAVVAAFAGEKNTGGWAVAIRSVQKKFVVDLLAPQKGSMTAQVITTPFQIVAVPVSEIEALSLELTPIWANKMKTYRVSKGNFEYSGGIRGLMKKFSVEGTIDVFSYGDNFTFNFNLSGKGKDQAMKLSDIASGVVTGGSVELARLDAGTFAEIPHPPLSVTGMIAEQKISLIFDSHPPTIADGFIAKGKIEAAKIR